MSSTIKYRLNERLSDRYFVSRVFYKDSGESKILSIRAENKLTENDALAELNKYLNEHNNRP